MNVKPMTARRWPRSTDPHEMLSYLGQQASDRKLRLYLCVCCRRISHLAWGERIPQLLQILEGVADGLVKAKEWKRAIRECYRASQSPANHAQSCLLGAIRYALMSPVDRAFVNLGEFAASAFGYGEGTVIDWNAKARELREQSAILREIFGNPFYPVAFKSEWRTKDVMLLAKGTYEEPAFDRMPILADALQDAGCDSDDLLSHLRDTTAAHVRGCWALDLVLGKD